MSFFIVTFLGLIAVVLILAPLAWSVSKDNALLSSYLHDARQEVADTFKQSEYYRIAWEHASDGMIVQDENGLIIWCNPAYCALFSTTSDQILGRNPLSFALPPDIAPTAEEIEEQAFDLTEGKLHLCENHDANGVRFWNQINIKFRRSAAGLRYSIAVCRDVTEQVARENELREIGQKLETEATHDGLTGVPNRGAFLTFIETALRPPDHNPVGLLHIDLDNFKAVNDTHGHSGGDAVLICTAQRISDSIRDCDLVARIGGDEFVVVCPDCADLSVLDDFAQRLLGAIAEPFEWSNCILHSEVSIGASLSSPNNRDAGDLLMQADFALYEAKRAGRNQIALYDEDLHERHASRIRRAAELADAIDTGAMDYFFQPKMSLTTGEIVSVETLVRWNHPTEGIIPPDEFLPMVQDLGLMGALDLWSMTAALGQKRELDSSGFEDVCIAFNASPELLGHPEFINRLIWGVEAAGIKREQVTIEVLETTDFGDVTVKNSHAAIIGDLRSAGFQVHLDDFGVGFAGLSHLATLSVTGVKIDRGLVTDLLTDETSCKIVRKIVELSNDLGLTVIAEGVEDLRTADALRKMGCGIIQGYWLSRPLPERDLGEWLLSRRQEPTDLRA